LFSGGDGSFRLLSRKVFRRSCKGDEFVNGIFEALRSVILSLCFIIDLFVKVYMKFSEAQIVVKAIKQRFTRIARYVIEEPGNDQEDGEKIGEQKNLR